MNDIDYVIAIYFHNVSAYNILHNDINYKRFDEKEFIRLMFTELPNISESEAEEVYRYLEEFKEEISGENGLNVFRTLKEVTAKFLKIYENSPICRYDKIGSWRKLLEGVSEDLLVCAFLARETEKKGEVWNEFCWNPVISHDNVQLNRIMERGLSDNHFHLFGSAPSFKLIWLHLMNNFLRERDIKALQMIDNDRRSVGKNYSYSYKEEPLVQMRFKAGVIRVYLVSYIDKAMRGKLDDEREEKYQKDIQIVLESEYPHYEYYAKLQEYIDGVKLSNLAICDDYVDDYACPLSGNRDINKEFEGERRLMYQMLQGEVNNKKIPGKLMNWFYAYLVIQHKFREELVQTNANVGFENFSRYNKRKSGFLDTESDMEKMIKYAVGGSLESGNIYSLELRISPEKSAVENKRYIDRCDFYIRTNVGDYACQRTYYVFHFPKKRDDKLCIEEGYVDRWRHYKFRKDIEYRAEQIIEFREKYPELANRVLGIDACAQELYCRPEVFATSFRMLAGHVVHNIFDEKVCQLRITYHAGEDWFDIIDGLRAIDEAIFFLGMRNGDRLGHATVLGIDVQEWYAKKNKVIWISLQNYLDNVVWLYHKLIEFDVSDCESLKGFLMSEYDLYFRELYSDVLEHDFSSYTIETYYSAWKLRGDHPQLYATGQFEYPIFNRLAYMVNDNLEEGTLIRKEKEVVSLLYNYHFSASVRNKAKKSYHKKISSTYIKGVQCVQKAMQQYVSKCGISIETNPSSNYKISTIDEYAKHPILNFYNIGLTWNENKLRECPQLHVSINTDDKGIFDTSLENEYALMGYAVENVKDENGNNIYNKQMVYDWLEHIRQNGNQQSFLKDIWGNEVGGSNTKNHSLKTDIGKK